MVYAERKLDFVDTLLYAYNKLGKHEVYTFSFVLNEDFMDWTVPKATVII